MATIHEALTLGTDELAVDGVLLVAELGDYEVNDKEQKLYPRFELFLQITDTFRRCHRAVPVFNDKHLSYRWTHAKRMYDISKELDFPFMAGSSLPVNYRYPDIELPLGSRARYGLVVAAVQCLEGAAIWQFLDATPWAQKLFDATLERSQRPAADPRDDDKAALFRVWYRDGVETAIFRLPAGAGDFCVAVDVEGQQEPLSTMIWRSRHDNRSFDAMILRIDEMYESGQSTYPIERTLLVSGVLDLLLESRIQEHRRIETPQLDVAYHVGERSFHVTANSSTPWGVMPSASDTD
jgi:hypothetical protein